MGYELGWGTLFATIEGQTMKLGEGIPFTEEVELSAKESLSRFYHLQAASQMSLTVDGANLEFFKNLWDMPLSNGKFTMKYQLSIMIQARWHKKARIRKKWLKRFGMKPDTVEVRVDATMGEYNGYEDYFELESDSLEYILRPDQMRRGLEIEW